MRLLLAGSSKSRQWAEVSALSALCMRIINFREGGGPILQVLL